MPQQRLTIAVVGAGSCDDDLARLAYEVGPEIARQDAILLGGGRGGVMERAASGARDGGGRTIGILPGRSAEESPPNRSIELPIFTGLGQARNQVLVLSAHAVIAVGGGWGTLSEIGLAMKHGIPVVLLESWRLSHPVEGLESQLARAETARRAVDKAISATYGTSGGAEARRDQESDHES